MSFCIMIYDCFSREVWNDEPFYGRGWRWARANDTANGKVGIGVIGLGGRGRDHLKYYSKLPDARVVAICDVNQAQTERATQIVEKLHGNKPHVHQDLRKLFEDKDVDAVSIATPNHWHALATIWACQAGKDVYCEKPACYNLFEGRAMEAAARKYKRIVQIGMQGRTIAHKQRAMDLLHSGAIGQVYMARGICFKRRPSIGHPHRAGPGGARLGPLPGPRAHARVHQESLSVQLALVLGHGQRRHRQPGHP
jgi:predicted dehydrogenase